MGALDFAGGAVVHINAGAAALAVVLIIGKRKGWPDEPMPPHTLPWTLIGTGILWFGWAGFNAGSALGANGVAAQALLNTFVAASAAMLGWLLVERLKDGHATTLGAASGAVAGLVAITPCAGFVGSMPAIIIGFAAGAVCFLALGLKKAFKFDDALDVIAVHLVGGLLGSLMLGLFADPKVNAARRPTRACSSRRRRRAADGPGRGRGRHARATRSSCRSSSPRPSTSYGPAGQRGRRGPRSGPVQHAETAYT